MGRIFPHPQGYPWRFRGRGNQSIPGGCNNFVTFLVRREMPGIWFWEIILLRDLAVIELFQISHNCVTKCTLQAKFLLKLTSKLLEISFFPIYKISQYVIFLSNRRRKFKLLGLQGDPRFPVTSLMGTSWSLREENLEGGWSAHFNDSLSKQNFYSM